MRGDSRLILLIAIALTFLFGIVAFHESSLIRSPEALDGFLTGELPPGHWIFEYAPFKYRVVFHQSVSLLSGVMTGDTPVTKFQRSFVLCSGICFVAAGVTLYLLLRTLGFARPLAALGTAAWSTLPPVLGAYMMPTQTREDFLAYAILNAALAAILGHRTAWIFVLAAVGVVTRETLLLIPVLFLMAAGYELRVRLALLLVAISAYLAVRLALGMESYPAVATGLLFTLSNLQTAAIAAAMLFGWGWLMVPRRRAQSIDPLSPEIAKRRSQFERWTLPSLLLVVGTHVLLARLEEIRISMLYAPWLIYALLRLIEARRLPMVRVAAAALAAVAVLAAFEVSGLASVVREHVNPSLSYFATREWWLIAYIQLIVVAAIVSLAGRGSAVAGTRSA